MICDIIFQSKGLTRRSKHNSWGAFFRRLSDNSPRIVRRPVRAGRESVAGPSGIRWARQRTRQSNFRRRRDLEIPDGCSLARHADALRRLEEHSHAVLTLGDQRGLAKSYSRRWPMISTTSTPWIDATIVRAHQHSVGARKKKGVNQAIGRSRGGLTTKIHMIVDALGNPLAFTLTAGQVHDITQAETLTSQVQPEALLADKGYDANAYIASLRARAIKGGSAKANRKNKRDCDFALYRERNLVERFFQFIKQFRGIAGQRKNRAQFLGGVAAGVRAGLAQMRTRPSGPGEAARSSAMEKRINWRRPT